MKPYSISILARQYGLSRSTLLYYDRIGLLHASGRSGTGYRVYSERDRQRLERICTFREAGLSLGDIKSVLDTRGKPTVRTLERRLAELGREIAGLRQKQRLLSEMVRRSASGIRPPMVDKAMWVALLRSAGMDDAAMWRWHAEFEQRAPEAHEEFLVSLGITAEEVTHIRRLSAAAKS